MTLNLFYLFCAKSSYFYLPINANEVKSKCEYTIYLGIKQFYVKFTLY